MYDVAIVGLGPAGSTLARLLGPGLSVAAVDCKRGESGFRKPCGGLLAPDAQKALSRFDLALPKDVLVDPQIFAVRTLDLRTGLTRHYQRFYVNLDRHKFDLWLQALIPPRVDVFDGSRVTAVAREGGGWRVDCTRDGRAFSLTARYLVGADGAKSLVRRALYPGKKLRSYVAIQQWFRDDNPTPFYSCVFDPDNTDCYSWGISKDGRFLFGGAYPARGCRERFERQKRALAGRGFRFGEPLCTEACLVLRPEKPGDFCCGRDGAFLVGEAAGFISPSSLEGISSAVNSARILAGALNSGAADPCAAYRRGTRALRWKLLGKVLKCPFLYRPALRRLVMKSGLDSIPVNP